MIIQSKGNPATQLFSTTFPQQRQKTAVTAAVSADSVTISQSARNLLLSAPLESHTTPDSHKWLSEAAHSNPVQAEEIAYSFAYFPDSPLLDISGLENGTGIIRYSANGQPVTAESEAYFNSLSPGILRDRINLYETGKTKGTSAADIMDNIIDYMDSLPPRYQEMISWSDPNATT
jgi:hypothetical protein